MMEYWVLQEVSDTKELTHAIGPFPEEDLAERFVKQAAPVLAVMVTPSHQRVVTQEVLDKVLDETGAIERMRRQK